MRGAQQAKEGLVAQPPGPGGPLRVGGAGRRGGSEMNSTAETGCREQAHIVSTRETAQGQQQEATVTGDRGGWDEGVRQRRKG